MPAAAVAVAVALCLPRLTRHHPRIARTRLIDARRAVPSAREAAGEGVQGLTLRTRLRDQIRLRPEMVVG